MCVCVCVCVCVAVTVGSDSEDEDDEEDDDEECLKKLRQKVCMPMCLHMYLCKHLLVGMFGQC